MKTIVFHKAVASGNDFLIIDRSKEKAPARKEDLSRLAISLCRRKYSVGADGLLIIERSKTEDFMMRILNPDGSEVDMCGNGSRCVAVYARSHGISKTNKMFIETRAGILEAEATKDGAKIGMSKPKDLRLNFDLDVEGVTYSANFINTGVPHVVCFVKNIDDIDVKGLGRSIRFHSEFQPDGTNANFVEVQDKSHIKVRTYERGVEDETLACGTGSVASAIVTALDMQKETAKASYKIKVTPASKECLTIYFDVDEDNIGPVYMQGNAQVLYQGTITV